MKTIVIYSSAHHRNTEKVAQAIAITLDAELKKPSEISTSNFLEYDLIGFGSGIYFCKHHRALLSFVENLPVLNKKVFIFSTRGGGPANFYHRVLRNALAGKGCTIIAEFSCKGFDAFGPLKLIGGMNNGRPNEKDLENARNFAKSLIEKFNR